MDVVPLAVRREDVTAALACLGLTPDNVLEVTIGRRRVTVVHRRTAPGGRAVAAGEEIATVTTTVGIQNPQLRGSDAAA